MKRVCENAAYRELLNNNNIKARDGMSGIK